MVINNRKGYFFNLSSTASIRTIAPTYCSSDADCPIPGEYCLEVGEGVRICGVPGTTPPGSPGPCEYELDDGWCVGIDGNTCHTKVCQEEIDLLGDFYCECWYEDFDCGTKECSVSGGDCTCVCGGEGAECCPGGVCDSGLWCDTSPNPDRCCPVGCEWSVDDNQCECHDPCYSAPCNWRPPDDPLGGQGSWWTDPYCLKTTKACCYAGILYGGIPWYDYTTYSIVVY